MVYQDQITFGTSGHRDIHDVTDEVAKIVDDAGVARGMVHVFNVGSTAAIGNIEFEPGLQGDLPELLDRLIPPSRDYGHERTWHDGNGHSHLQATLLGPSLTVPIRDGRLVLGTWQQIFHLECDIKPRQRTIVVTVYGSSTPNARHCRKWVPAIYSTGPVQAPVAVGPSQRSNQGQNAR